MPYTTDGRLWQNAQCKLNITGPGWPNTWISAANAAMKTWNSAGSKFAFATSTAATDHLAAYDNGRWNGWLAMTNTQPRTAHSLLTSGYVVINTHYEWDPVHPTLPHTDSGGHYDLESVLVHELGHLLHLGDDPTARVVMQGTTKPKTLRRSLGPDDVAGVRYLYPMLAAFEISDLAREALAIVRGTVVASEYAVVSSRVPSIEGLPSLLFSVHRVRVDQALKAHGMLSGEIDVLTLGGRTPTLSVHVESEAALTPGENVVLFLSQDHRGLTKDQGHWPWQLERVDRSWQGPQWRPVPADYPGGFSVFGGYQGKYSIYRRGDSSYVWRKGMPISEAGFSLDDLENQINS